MEAIFNVLLISHIICGSISIITGPIPAITQKGGKWHNQTGMIYFWAMTGVFITCIPMSFMKGNVFLFTIGIFSYYAVFTGLRFAKMKGYGKLTILDKRVFQVTFITSIIMILYAGYLYFYLNSSEPAIILLVFGLLCLKGSKEDLDKWGIPQNKGNWIIVHLTRMLGSYIAATTAFLVTALYSIFPPIVLWLGPTVIGGYWIFLSQRYYVKKYKLKLDTVTE